MIHSPRAVAWRIGIPLRHLVAIAYDADIHYSPFDLKRSNKKARHIDNPDEELKQVQRVMRARLLLRYPVDESVRACVNGGSPLKHARALTGFENVSQTDLKNCYPRLTSRMVFQMFAGHGFGPRAASLLTKLCTWLGHLPQGAPTSDIVANLVLKPLDERVKKIARDRDLKYSRCMDGFFLAGDGRTREAIGLVIGEIRKAGLAVRRAKTQNAGAGRPQMVVGFNVNTRLGPKVGRKAVQKIRTDVHRLIQAHRLGENIDRRLASVKGSLAYLRQTNAGVEKRLQRQLASAHIGYR